MRMLAVALLCAGCTQLPSLDPYLSSSSRYSAVFVIGGPSPKVSLITSTPSNHLVTVDVRTGERVAATALSCASRGKSPKLYPPVDGLAWVRCGAAEAYVLDLRTGKTVVTAEQLVARNSELSAGFRVRESSISYDVDPPVHRLPVTLHDGRVVYLDLAGGLHFERGPATPWVPGYYCWPEHKCSRARKECLGFARSPTGQGYVLSHNRIHGDSDSPVGLIGSWPAGLLKPGLVGEPDSRCAFEWEEQHLILHDSAAFEPKESLLSLVRRDGTSLWSQRYAALGATQTQQPRMAVRVGDEILVLITHRRERSYLRTALLKASTGEISLAHDVFGRVN